MNRAFFRSELYVTHIAYSIYIYMYIYVCVYTVLWGPKYVNRAYFQLFGAPGIAVARLPSTSGPSPCRRCRGPQLWPRNSQAASNYWVVVKELNPSYRNMDVYQIARFLDYVNLINVP